jgi:hypothetical protein
LRVGSPNRSLDRALAAHGTSRWAFITAWNPQSELRAHWFNTARHLTLLYSLRRAGFVWVSAVAQSDTFDWPPEIGVLVLGITRAQVRRLGRRFRQNAVVVGRRSGAAELVWCSRGEALGGRREARGAGNAWESRYDRG